MQPLAASNHRLRRLRRLTRRRSLRVSEGVVVLEGSTIVAEALDGGVHLLEAYHEPGTDDALVGALERAGVDHHPVEPGAVARVADTVNAQGVIALARRPDTSLHGLVASLATLDAPFVLVAVDLADPGNVGTLVRAAEACGAAGIVCCGGADPLGPKAVRASAGLALSVPLVVEPDPETALARLSEAGLAIAATAVDEGRVPDDGVLVGPVAIVVGNEARGVAAHVIERADARVRIPTVGRAESLNVAMAGAILCYEASRSRRAPNAAGVASADTARTP
ncbi:MAG: RNA methyltransferase [Actinomycetota bacterium]|nr:RNA methyltransferase [Actinomycetota bacterium]